MTTTTITMATITTVVTTTMATPTSIRSLSLVCSAMVRGGKGMYDYRKEEKFRVSRRAGV
jgi:hypothetical protein